jgi:hypothetical protein
MVTLIILKQMIIFTVLAVKKYIEKVVLIFVQIRTKKHYYCYSSNKYSRLNQLINNKSKKEN